MSASHNPGGPKEDWGIKFNYSSGEPAPERITDAIFGYTQKISELKMADLPDIDLSELGTKDFGGFSVSPSDDVPLCQTIPQAVIVKRMGDTCGYLT